MRWGLLAALCGTLLLSGTARAAENPDARADAVLARMSLFDKETLVSGSSMCDRGADGRAIGPAALGIPDVMMVGAGQGVANICSPARNDVTGNTLLPAPLALAASWDEHAAYEDGALIGREARAAGMNTSIGGDVNLARDPRNGRTFEAEGEDPVLAGTIVGAQLRGTQAQHVIATIKHFALNNHEGDRGTQSSDVDERTMRELELRAFEIGIARSGVGAVMCSYNKVNGTNACEDEHLLTDVLKRDWGFKGWVMSDWWACSPESAYGDPVNGLCSTQKAALAGLDQEMPNARFFGPPLGAAILTGAVPMSRLDDMVHRILRTMFAAGVIDDPPVPGPIDASAGAAASQSIEERSAVLLRNAGDASCRSMRLRRQKIAVIGAPSDDVAPQGAGSPGVTPAKTDTALAAVRRSRRTPPSPTTTRRIRRTRRRPRRPPTSRSSSPRDSTSEGVDRPDLSLPVASQRCTLGGCYSTGGPDQDDVIAGGRQGQPAHRRGAEDGRPGD